MRRIMCCLMVLGIISLSACGRNKSEEAASEITQIATLPGEIQFSFPEEWLVTQENNNLLAENTITGTSVNIVYEDLNQTSGGSLIHIEDYVEALQETLKTSQDYTYRCEAAGQAQLYGKEYYHFVAAVEELGAVQHFYIRQIENEMMNMTITLYEEDALEAVLGYGKSAE